MTGCFQFSSSPDPRRGLVDADGNVVHRKEASGADINYTVSKNCTLTAAYSHFFAGSYLDDTGTGDDADFLYLIMGLKF